MLSTDSDKRIIKEMITKHENLLKGKEVYIFGCIVQARDIREELKVHGFCLSGFIDNNPNKAGSGKKCLGVPVIFPSDLSVKESIVIIICSKYFSEMSAQLIKLGFENRNIFRIPIDDDIKKYSDDEISVETAIKKICNGQKNYESIVRANPNLDKVFLCPYPGTGDIYMACSFLPLYLNMHKISNYVILVIGNSCKKVADLFEKGNVIKISQEISDDILTYWEFAGEDTLIKPLLYWSWRTKRNLYADHYPQITFTEMFLYDVYEYDDRPEIRKPKQDSVDSVRIDFLNNSLKEGKTVIMAPYAGSFVSELSSNAWKEIASILSKKGYTVCTNCSNENEVPIEGTSRVFFPYSQAIPFLELAGNFIGIRSGLCDVVSSSKSRKVILYEDGFNATRMSYFGLQKMGLCEEEIYEIDYSAMNEDELIATVVNFFE